MRRSAALLSFLLLLGAGVPGASAAPARTAALTIGIFEDPATATGVAVWAMLQLAQILTLGDELADHVREDVRRQQHPQNARAPRILPVQLPRPVPLLPVLPPRPVRPRPILDPLPLRQAS
jgi:hypothetical protein